MNKEQKTIPGPTYPVKDIVFITAFLREEKNKYYVCKAEIIEAPAFNQRQIYKVKIIAVADRAIGSLPAPTQATLLGRVITKRENEINKEVSQFMLPKHWITINPDIKV